MGDFGRLALGIVGAAVGFVVGGPAGAAFGYSLGSIAGSAIFPVHGQAQQVNGPRLNEFQFQSSSYGAFIPQVYGTALVAGELIWSLPRKETRRDETTSVETGKKSSTDVTTTTYTYSQSFAVRLCKGPIKGVARVWANGKLIKDFRAGQSISDYLNGLTSGGFDATVGGKVVTKSGTSIRIYLGTEDQVEDPLILASEGYCPAYRGYAYIVFEDLQLGQFDNGMPNMTFEVVGGNAGDILPETAQFLDAPGQLANQADGSITPDGHLLVIYTTSFVAPTTIPATTKFVLLHGTTLQVIREYNPLPWMGSEIPTCNYAAPQMNSRGDICFVSRGGFVWIWANGGVPVQLTFAGDATRISVDESGNFYFGARRISAEYGFYRVDAGTSSLVTLLIVTSQTNDLFDGRDGYLYASWGSSVGHLVKLQRDSGSVVATRDVSGGVIGGIAAAGDGSVFYLTNPRGTGHDQELWRVASDFASEAKLYDSGGTHFQQVIARPGRDWSNGDVIYADLSVARRYNEDGTLVSSLSVGDTTRVATHPSFPERIYLFEAYGASPQSQRLGVIVPSSIETGSAILGNVVADIAEQAGVTAGELDVATLTDEVRGFTLTQRAQAKANIKPLSDVFGFDMVESGDKLKAVKRGGASALTIPTTDLLQKTDDSVDSFVTARTPDTDLPYEASLSYVDYDYDYQVGTQYARRLIGSSSNALDITAPIVLTSTEASRAITRMLYEAWMERCQYTVTLSKKYTRLEPTDVVTFQNDEDIQLRLVKKSEGIGNLTFDAVGYDPSVYSQIVQGSTHQEQTLGTQRGPSNTVLLDIPLLRDTDDDWGFYVAAGGYLDSAWPGAGFWRSTDSGVTYSDTGLALVGQNTIGYAQTALADFSGGNVFDNTSTVDVALLSGSASSTTELNVLGGANWWLIGSEIVGAKTATLIADNTYRLSGLLRGRQGTEWAMKRHVVNENAVLLTGVNRMAVTSSDWNAQRLYKAPTFGRTLDSASAKSFTLQASGLKPLSPVQCSGTRDGSNNVTATWVRRARKNNGWNDYVDVPLDEPTEAYDVDFFAGATKSISSITRTTDGEFTTSTAHGLSTSSSIYITGCGGMTALNDRPFTVATVPSTTKFTVGEDTSYYPAYTSGGVLRVRGRTVPVGATFALYTAASQTTDYGSAQNPIYYAVYQKSSRVGRGYPGTGVI